jgi:hypothetical protein
MLIITASSSRKHIVKRSLFFRLRQHNGELKGGAKAASAGRPWNLACLVEGFANISEG